MGQNWRSETKPGASCRKNEISDGLEEFLKSVNPEGTTRNPFFIQICTNKRYNKSKKVSSYVSEIFKTFFENFEKRSSTRISWSAVSLTKWVFLQDFEGLVAWQSLDSGLNWLNISKIFLKILKNPKRLSFKKEIPWSFTSLIKLILAKEFEGVVLLRPLTIYWKFWEYL